MWLLYAFAAMAILSIDGPRLFPMTCAFTRRSLQICCLAMCQLYAYSENTQTAELPAGVIVASRWNVLIRLLRGVSILSTDMSIMLRHDGLLQHVLEAICGGWTVNRRANERVTLVVHENPRSVRDIFPDVPLYIAEVHKGKILFERVCSHADASEPSAVAGNADARKHSTCQDSTVECD